MTIEAAITTGRSPSKQRLASLSLASGQVTTVHLDGMASAPDLRASVIVETDAPKGDLLTKLLSRGTSGGHIVESLDKELRDGPNSGGHPWSTAAGIVSTLLLFNHDAAPQWFNIRFANGSGKKPWMKRYRLASMETLAVSINDLIANQEKDDHGDKLIIRQSAGEVGWQSDTPNAAGRLLQANPVSGMARNFSCNNYYTVCGATVYPSILELGFDLTGPFSGSWDWNLSHQGPSNSCSCSSQSSASITTYESWTSGNAGIASIQSGSNSASSTWFGKSGGNTTGAFSVSGPYNLTCEAEGPVDVCPSSTTVVGAPIGINWNPAQYPTGIGDVFSIAVGPANSSNNNFNGTQLTESATANPVGTSCSSAVLNLLPGACSANATFTVAGGGNDPFGNYYPPINNSFWDIHAVFASQDVLGLAGSGNCNISCTQTYYCGGVQAGAKHTYTYMLQHVKEPSGWATMVTSTEN